MEFRIETDTMGEVKVPAHVYWGAQTERSRNNFKIGPEASMPKEIIYAFAYLKKAAAQANCELGVLSQEKSDLIGKVCDCNTNASVPRTDSSKRTNISPLAKSYAESFANSTPSSRATASANAG